MGVGPLYPLVPPQLSSGFALAVISIKRIKMENIFQMSQLTYFCAYNYPGISNRSKNL